MKKKIKKKRINIVPDMPDISDFIKRILAGDQGAGAKMIRLIEEDHPKAFELLRALYPHSGKGFIIGITGSPGAGKSTVINGLITQFRKRDLKVGVIAVDPSSPFSGGAILGDRLRMQSHALDEKVFIRSMGSRGQAGGLSRVTRDAAVVLDAMGYEIILIETVGAGQGEFEVSFLAHSVGIVTVPGTCNGIQAVKAGILETGDIFIVNKGDMADADVSVHQLSMMIEMGNRTGWKPPVIRINALDNNGLKAGGLETGGLEALAEAFLSHCEFMKINNLMEEKHKEQERLYFTSLLKDLTMKKLLVFIQNAPEYKEVLNKIGSGEMDPLTAAELVVKQMISP